MSTRTTTVDHPISMELDGRTVLAREGEPVAVALIAAGETLFSRSSKYHRPRGAFCLSGGCGQCLMRVDGVPSVPTCRVPAKAGLRLERQNAFPDATFDLFAATDLIFRSWFNHHEFLTGVPLGDKVLLQVAKRLAGLGVLPEHAPPQREPAVKEQVTVAIVGGGAAGLSAARKLTERKVPYVLFEAEAQLGGRLITGAEEGTPAVYLPPANQVRTGATVVGLYADDGPRFLAVLQQGRLHLVFPQLLLLTHGGQPGLPTFANNDLPGIYAARAVSRLIRQHGVIPGSTIAVVGELHEARALAKLISAAGACAVGVGAEPVEAHGQHRVEELTVRAAGKEERLACDAVALCGPQNPAFELARAAGAKVSWSAEQRLFTVEADMNGRTADADVFVAGELRGGMSATFAAEQGMLAAEAITATLEKRSAGSAP